MSIRWWHWLTALCLAVALEALLVWIIGLVTAESAPPRAGSTLTRISLGGSSAPEPPEIPDLPTKAPIRPKVSTKLPQPATTPQKPPPIAPKAQRIPTEEPVDATLSHSAAPGPTPVPSPAPKSASSERVQSESVRPERADPAAVASASAPSRSPAAVEVEKNAYRAQLVAHLAAKRRYPLLAQRGGQEGEVAVSFELTADGTLRSRRLLKASGHALLDQAGLATVDRASPFPAVPQVFGAGPYVFTVPLRFDLR